jgi:hypothetical protein
MDLAEFTKYVHKYADTIFVRVDRENRAWSALSEHDKGFWLGVWWARHENSGGFWTPARILPEFED